MDYKDFYNYFYNVYCIIPLSAQVNKQEKTIFYLKMELAKLKKKIRELSNDTED